MRRIVPFAVLTCFLAAQPRPSAAQGSATGTQYVTFWRGDLRIVATRGRTQVTIVDVTTGAALSATQWIGNYATNPFVLASPGDSFEASSSLVPPAVLTHRIRIV